MAKKTPAPHTDLLPVAFTGARGAYSQQAARRFFGRGRPGLTCNTVCEAVRAVDDGRASHAVLPVENTITGCFAGVAEALFEGNVDIVGEVVFPIRHCLLACSGTRLEDVTVVTSHPSALAQCRDWLTSWGVATRASNDTAQAAEELGRSGDAALGVLGSRELAEMYALEILAEGLSDRTDNRTRFLVLAAGGQEGRQAGDRSGALVGPVTAPRTLKTLRIQLESRGARRVRVPFLGSEDGRRFLIELDHVDGAGQALLEQACGNLPYRYLGAWASLPETPTGNGKNEE